MARLLIYPLIACGVLWHVLVYLKSGGELPAWATWTVVHGAPAAAYLAWALVVSIVCAMRRWRVRYSLRSLLLFVALACSCEGLYIFRGPWRPERTLAGHKGGVVSASFSPDGRRIVTAGGDHTARVWDSSSGSELAVLKGHTDWVGSASFSPDGGRIVTASRDGTARVWDSSGGSELAVLRGHKGWVFSASFSPDGGRVVTASEDGTARIWDSSGASELAVIEGHTSYVYSASFSPDGRRVVTVNYDRTARVWDSSTGSELSVLRGHRGPVYSASFSSDGRRIVTTAGDATARIWRRTRPEPWWGFAAMPGFWVAVFFAAALVWSLLTDRRTFAKMDQARAAASSL